MRAFLLSLLMLATALPARADEQPPAGGARLDEPGRYFYFRTNPLSLAVHGRTLHPEPGGGKVGLFSDIVSVGITGRRRDYMLSLLKQNFLPDENEFSVLAARFTVDWRPLKNGHLALFDPYLLGGVALGGAGRMTREDATCTTDCALQRNGWGGGLHAGIGVDFNWVLYDDGGGRRGEAFVAFEVREELFITGERASFFTVYSLPFGIRFKRP